MMRRLRPTVVALVIGGFGGLSAPLHAHSGPPYPIVSNQQAGAYVVSLWSDPDTTDDGTPGGQFWVVTARANTTDPPPAGTHAAVTVTPVGGGTPRSAVTDPVRGDIANQFGAVPLDREGRFAVHVTLDGPLGPASIDTEVTATYDLRPAPLMLLWYVVPFLMAGFLWSKLLMRRRRESPPSRPAA